MRPRCCARRRGNLLTRARHAAHRLLQRYQNVKGELEAQQNLERIKVEKAAKSKRRAMKIRAGR